jgi:hypothetical protein
MAYKMDVHFPPKASPEGVYGKNELLSLGNSEFMSGRK